MSAEIRTVVTFQSSRFNMSEPKPYFINDCCFGDDVAKWLMQELRREGYDTADSPGQEDFGWYLTFKVAGVNHCFVLSHRPGDSSAQGGWIGWLERSRSLLPSLFGGGERGIAPEAVSAVHGILKSEPTIREIHWHFKSDFDAGREERGVLAP